MRKNLQSYADRGVFRGFSESRNNRGGPIFRFLWLTPGPHELSVDTTKHVLRFSRLLPGVPAGSEFHLALKNFVAERHDRALPEHRRIDRRRAEASFTNRSGIISLALEVKNDQYGYGVNRIVNLVHELFVHLRDVYPEYLVENFDAPLE